jgi:RNA polymerase sigma-70 factor (ECF subfamily)
MSATAARRGLEEAFRHSERALWGLCYRMTGSAAEADDLVQETFARALERPPARTDLPWRPWLVRVAMNLARDALRRRRRRAYRGPWLPSPVETASEPPAYEPLDDGAAGRYDLLESVSYAFLVALEALKPRERAVLLLRDVYDYSVRETAVALGLSEANVKTTLHRARRAMLAYDAGRQVPSDELRARTRETLERLMTALLQEDVAAFEALLADDVHEASDGGGEFYAAGVPILGRAKVVRFFLKLRHKRGLPARATIRELNGLPAMLIETSEARPREARRFVVRCDLGSDGRVAAIHSILASAKLTAVSFD